MNVDDYEDHVDARERDEKMNRQQATIDALVAALTEARDHIRSCFGTDDRPDSDSADIVRTADAALAMARKGG